MTLVIVACSVTLWHVADPACLATFSQGTNVALYYLYVAPAQHAATHHNCKSFVGSQSFSMQPYGTITTCFLKHLPSQNSLRASRISILFTIVRLTVRGSLRNTLMFVFAAFIVAWIILFAQVFWVCEAEPGWKSLPRPQCDLGRNVAIAQIISKPNLKLKRDGCLI